MYAYICPDCGAYLDPGEFCDCRKEEKVALGVGAPRATADSRVFQKRSEKLCLNNTQKSEKCQYGLLGNAPRV